MLLASDSPQVTVGQIAHAFAQLDRHELVFGPVYDGGYYLIGMRGWHDVLRGVPMSTGTVPARDRRAGAAGGCSVGWVAPIFDMDEADDLVYLHAAALQPPRPGRDPRGATPDRSALRRPRCCHPSLRPPLPDNQEYHAHRPPENNRDPAERALAHGN